MRYTVNRAFSKHRKARGEGRQSSPNARCCNLLLTVNLTISNYKGRQGGPPYPREFRFSSCETW